MDLKPHVFYGDLNCPFCYAQNERLQTLGAAYLVEWRGINHMPDLPFPMRETPEDAHRLRDEVRAIRIRAPELTIEAPDARPHSGLATRVIAEARSLDERRARALKDLTYRALWREGQDISRLEVMAELTKRVGLPAPVQPDRLAPQVDQWHQEWAQGPFERRLPAMQSRMGGLMLGLGTAEELSTFLWIQADARNPHDSC